MPHDDAHAVAERGPCFFQAQQMKDVIAVDHHAAQHSEFWNGWTHQGHVGAEQFAVEGLRFDRATSEHRALEL